MKNLESNKKIKISKDILLLQNMMIFRVLFIFFKNIYLND